MASRDSGRSVGSLAITGGILLVVIFVGYLILTAVFAVRVDASEVCGIWQNGKVEEKADTGFNRRNPFTTRYKCYDATTLTYETTDGSGNATYKDSAMGSVKSSDGVASNVYVLLTFRINRDQVPLIYSTYGKTMDTVVEKYVAPQTRGAVVNIFGKKTMDAIYLGGQETTQAEIAAALKPVIESYGLVFIDFRMTQVDPEQKYKDAVAAQQSEAQNAKVEEAKVVTAEQQAEQARVTAQGQADAKLIEANAEAEANNVIQASLTDAPELLQYKYIETLGTVTWMILPSDNGIVPTLPLDVPSDEPTPTPPAG